MTTGASRLLQRLQIQRQRLDIGGRQVRQVHACLEATGIYGDAPATWLHDAGHVVSVVNPALIHAYAGAQLRARRPIASTPT